MKLNVDIGIFGLRPTILPLCPTLLPFYSILNSNSIEIIHSILIPLVLQYA